MHSLVVSCICSDWPSNLQSWRIGTNSSQLSCRARTNWGTRPGHYERFLTCRPRGHISQVHQNSLTCLFKMQISKPRKSKSVHVGLGNLHFNMDPQIVPIYIQVWESLDWSSWMHFKGLWTLKLHSAFCASVLCTFTERICFIKFSKGPWPWKGKEHWLQKKNIIGVVLSFASFWPPAGNEEWLSQLEIAIFTLFTGRVFPTLTPTLTPPHPFSPWLESSPKEQAPSITSFTAENSSYWQNFFYSKWYRIVIPPIYIKCTELVDSVTQVV